MPTRAGPNPQGLQQRVGGIDRSPTAPLPDSNTPVRNASTSQRNAALQLTVRIPARKSRSPDCSLMLSCDDIDSPAGLDESELPLVCYRVSCLSGAGSTHSYPSPSLASRPQCTEPAAGSTLL
ncbi:hypothetical protein SKAU_G00260530 [Synaphobranchus kaupii]|uniref:Uncharacterized protein n=1 Tax=Synaphobranchus kaupii TaxID=118154 RepID=A0A9Q1F4L3_SYNKA|nr:hypothetical protein SKAU_G00260530 [Synaphobranchus kaupii]